MYTHVSVYKINVWLNIPDVCISNMCLIWHAVLDCDVLVDVRVKVTRRAFNGNVVIWTPDHPSYHSLHATYGPPKLSLTTCNLWATQAITHYMQLFAFHLVHGVCACVCVCGCVIEFVYFVCVIKTSTSIRVCTCDKNIALINCNAVCVCVCARLFVIQTLEDIRYYNVQSPGLCLRSSLCNHV